MIFLYHYVFIFHKKKASKVAALSFLTRFRKNVYTFVKYWKIFINNFIIHNNFFFNYQRYWKM